MDKESLEHEVVSKGVFRAGLSVQKNSFSTKSSPDEDRRRPQFLKNLTAKTFDWCSDPPKPVGD
jgi:hypothetical protein